MCCHGWDLLLKLFEAGQNEVEKYLDLEAMGRMGRKKMTKKREKRWRDKIRRQCGHVSCETGL